MSEPSFPPANIVMNNSSSISKNKKKRNKKKSRKAGSSQPPSATPVSPTEEVTQGETGEFASNDSLNQDESAVTAPTTPEDEPKDTENVDHPEEIGAGEQGAVGQPEELYDQKDTLVPPQRRDADEDPSPTVPREDMTPFAVTPDTSFKEQEETTTHDMAPVQTQPLAPNPVAVNAPQLTEDSTFQESTSIVPPLLTSSAETKETFSQTEPNVQSVAMEQSLGYHELSDNEENCVQSAVQSKFIDIDSIMKQVKENIEKGMYETSETSHETFGASAAAAAAALATGAVPTSSTTTVDTTTDENVKDEPDTTESTVLAQENTVKQPESAVVNEQPTATQPKTATATQQNVAITPNTNIEQGNVPQPASANASQQTITDNAPQQAITDNAPQRVIPNNAPQQLPFDNVNNASQQPDSTVTSRPAKSKKSSQLRTSIISAVKKKKSCVIL